MHERTRIAALLELAMLLLCLSCQHPARKKQPSPASLAPRPASSFVCDAQGCVQHHPRLPDTGEWRCAELERVVWCAGGEPAAAVVAGVKDPAFRCGPRWGTPGERVCVDERPEYPPADQGEYRCRFEQERGIARFCKPAAAATDPPPGALTARAVPACWLSKDCRSGSCRLGHCVCQADADCDVGRCEQGLCREGKR